MCVFFRYTMRVCEAMHFMFLVWASACLFHLSGAVQCMYGLLREVSLNRITHICYFLSPNRTRDGTRSRQPGTRRTTPRFRSTWPASLTALAVAGEEEAEAGGGLAPPGWDPRDAGGAVVAAGEEAVAVAMVVVAVIS